MHLYVDVYKWIILCLLKWINFSFHRIAIKKGKNNHLRSLFLNLCQTASSEIRDYQMKGLKISSRWPLTFFSLSLSRSNIHHLLCSFLYWNESNSSLKTSLRWSNWPQKVQPYPAWDIDDQSWRLFKTYELFKAVVTDLRSLFFPFKYYSPCMPDLCDLSHFFILFSFSYHFIILSIIKTLKNLNKNFKRQL